MRAPTGHSTSLQYLLVLLVSCVQEISLSASKLDTLKGLNFRTPSHPINGTVGGSVLLPVSFDSIPGCGKITWKHMGRVPVRIAEMDLEQNRSRIYSSTPFEGRSSLLPNYTLRIGNLTPEDQGLYQVTVSVEAWEPVESIQLAVFEPVRGAIVTVTNISSTNRTCVATLSCSTEGGSAVSFSWRSEAALEEEGSPLEVTMEVGSAPSILVCTARNPVSWQTASVNLTKHCMAEYPAADQLSDPTSRPFVITVTTCGAVISILIAGGLVYWSQRERRREWRKTVLEGPRNVTGARVRQGHRESSPQAVRQTPADSPPPPETLPTSPPGNEAGEANTEYSVVRFTPGGREGVRVTEV